MFGCWHSARVLFRVTTARKLFLFGVVCELAWMLLASFSPATERGIHGWMDAGYRPPLVAIACGVVAITLAAASPWRPICGAAAVTWVGFGIARYTPLLEWAWSSGFQTCLVATAGIGILQCDSARQRLVISWESNKVWMLVLIGLLIWALVSDFIARLTSQSIPGYKHHALRSIESVFVLLIVFAIVKDRRSLAIVVSIAVGGVLSTTLQIHHLMGASDLAFVASPLACLLGGIGLHAGPLVLLWCSITATGLIALSVATANRGANVGLLVGAASLVTSRIRGIRNWIAVIGLLACVCYAALASPLRPRLDEWLNSGWQTKTLAERVEFWKASISVAPEHLIFGAGPGRGGQRMSEHLELERWRATHNSPLEMLSEQGVVGLLLWAGLIVLACLACRRGLDAPQQWRRGLAAGAGCCLLAMLVGSLAVSRHDDIRLFWVLGLAFAADCSFSATRRHEHP